LSFLLKLNKGEMQEWLNWHAWKACVPLKGTAGSNPALSADTGKPRESGAFYLVGFLVGMDPSDLFFIAIISEKFSNHRNFAYI
jgi:hypothetical protein